MMRQLILFFALCTFSSVLYAQDANPAEKTKYWIFLTDKLDASGKQTQMEESYLSDQALSRRTLRGEVDRSLQFRLQDAPISPIYEANLIYQGIKIKQHSRWLNAVTAYLSEDQVDPISTLPYVKEVRPVKHVAPHVEPSIPVSPVIPQRVSANCPSSKYGRSCTQLDVVNAIPAIEEGINGTGVWLGFIDTHYNTDRNAQPFNHPSLRHIPDSGRLMDVRDFTERDSSQPCLSWDNHGMDVASVAVSYSEGSLIGPGHGATIFGATTECVGYERNIEEDNYVAAVEWLESEGVDVITASLGYRDFDEGQRSYTPDELDGDTGLTTIALDLATQRGVVTVNSAGNGGPRPQTIATPADGDSVIAAGGIRSTRSVWSGSSRGPTSDNRIKPDVSAMASGVSVASPSFFGVNGTSFSAPMIAGIVTQILEVNPDLKPREVWHLLTSTASQALAPDNNLGWGIVDAYSAIKAAQSPALNRSSDPPLPSGKLMIHPPYPNPFNGVVHFTIESIEPVQHARLSIYDVLGRKVATIYEGPIQSGGFPIQFDGHGLSPGVYAYNLEYEGRAQSGTITHIGYK